LSDGKLISSDPEIIKISLTFYGNLNILERIFVPFSRNLSTFQAPKSAFSQKEYFLIYGSGNFFLKADLTWKIQRVAKPQNLKNRLYLLLQRKVAWNWSASTAWMPLTQVSDNGCDDN
jgi:hypothetical protein